jgi:hypothetical protein
MFDQLFSSKTANELGMNPALSVLAAGESRWWRESSDARSSSCGLKSHRWNPSVATAAPLLSEAR